MSPLIESQFGFAVVQADRIDVKTVCPTRKGAVINWLWERGYILLGTTLDEAIEATWQRESPKHGARVFEVSVSVVGHD